jgi:hypothetical protein
VHRTKIDKKNLKSVIQITIIIGASKNRLYHLFQLADEDLEGFKGSLQWQRWLAVNSIPV